MLVKILSASTSTVEPSIAVAIMHPKPAPLEKLNGLELPAAADMHVHLRDGDMTELVVYGNTYSSMLLKSGPNRVAVQPFDKAASTPSS